MRTEFHHADVLEFPWCSVTASPAPFTRLRGVTWTGNLLVFGFVLGLGTWSTFAPLESAAIAFGAVEAESSRKTIQHLEGGIVREIMVADGDVVRAGQTLIRLEDTKARAEVQSLRGQLLEAMGREARLLAEQRGHERVSFPNELETLQNENPAVSGVLAGQQKYLRNASTGLSFSSGRNSRKKVAGRERDRGP
jgi:HlyD family secretion protein